MRIEISFVIPDAVVQTAPHVAIAVLLALWLAIIVRRRRRKERERRLMFTISADFIPYGENPVIEEIRREVDASHKRFQRAMLEEQWRRDGSVTLERKAAT